MTERVIVLICAAIFIAGNIYAEWRNRERMPWWKNPLSAYLAGVSGSSVQDAAYLIFAAALVMFGFLLGDFWYILMGCIGSSALYMVVLTKLAIAEAGWRMEDAKLERVHILSAAVAFAFCTAMLLRYALLKDNQWVFWLTIAGVTIAFIFTILEHLSLLLPKSLGWFEANETVLEEKSFLAFLLAALGLVVLGG